MLINHILSKIDLTQPFFVIGIDGPTASGKTYLADNLAFELKKQNIPYFIYRLDWTLIDRVFRENEINAFVKSDSCFEYEADYHMDLYKAESFLFNLHNRFKANERFKITGLYSRDNGGLCNGEEEFVMQNKMVIILEGHYSHHHRLQKYIDFNIMLLAKPEELLRRKVIRASAYRSKSYVEEYFRYIDIPSFAHYLKHNGKYVNTVFNNTDFLNPVVCDKSALNWFLKPEPSACGSELPDLVDDFFSVSERRDFQTQTETKNALNLLFDFDFEASKLFGLSENVREVSFSTTLKSLINNQDFQLNWSDFKPLYSGLIQYFVVLSKPLVKILFFASSHNIRIILISEFTKKIYETDRIFSQFREKINISELIFSKINLIPDSKKCLVVPDKLHVNEKNITKDTKVIYTLSNNPALFFEKFIGSEFEFLHKFDDYEELICWHDIFNFCGFKQLRRDNFLYVNAQANFKPLLIEEYPFCAEFPPFTSQLSILDYELLSEAGLKYIDGVISGDVLSSDSFIKLYKHSSYTLQQLIWNWLLRHYSDSEVFPGVSLKRLYANLPSQLSDYYFALSLKKNSSIPFFTVYDLRENSLDINSYFQLSSKYRCPIGMQSSQNALDLESGYLHLNSPEQFAEKIFTVLINFLKKNPDKNIPLWSSGIDHVSSKMNKQSGWTKEFLKMVLLQGFISSICLDIESILSGNSSDLGNAEKILQEWMEVIPANIDIELATGEKLNLLSPEMYRDLAVILRKLMKRTGKIKSVFLMGPALGTTHHKNSDNTSPESSVRIFDSTCKYGNSGNVLHGTSFTNSEVMTEFVENNCVRVNFAGQYLAKIISSLPEETALAFGENQFDWKTSFSSNTKLLDKLKVNEIETVFNSIESLFVKHRTVLNALELSEDSAKYFRQPVTHIPDTIIQLIAQKCFANQFFGQNFNDKKAILLASMIEVPDDEFIGGLAKKVYKSGIRNFHVDVGDGVFISRAICGLPKLEYLLRNFDDINVHVHVMAESPHLSNNSEPSLIEKYAKKGVSVIYLCRKSFESDDDFNYALNIIRSHKINPGIVFNPDSEYSEPNFNDLIKFDIHYIQLMGVYSGRGGQRFIPEVIKAVSLYNNEAIKRNYDLKIEVDGGLTEKIAVQCRNAGAVFLSGWSVFLTNGKENLEKTVKRLLNEI